MGKSEDRHDSNDCQGIWLCHKEKHMSRVIQTKFQNDWTILTQTLTWNRFFFLFRIKTMTVAMTQMPLRHTANNNREKKRERE